MFTNDSMDGFSFVATQIRSAADLFHCDLEIHLQNFTTCVEKLSRSQGIVRSLGMNITIRIQNLRDKNIQVGLETYLV